MAAVVTWVAAVAATWVGLAVSTWEAGVAVTWVAAATSAVGDTRPLLMDLLREPRLL